MRTTLPERQVDADSKDTVKVGIGLVATMTALILGLVNVSAKNSFDAVDAAVKKTATEMLGPHLSISTCKALTMAMPCWLSAALIAVFLSFTAPLHGEEVKRVTVLYDAFGPPSALVKDWGFAALVEYGGKRILFDTGNNAKIFNTTPSNSALI